MNRHGSRLILGLAVLALAGCAGAESQYAQGSASVRSPSVTETRPSIATAPWRDSEVVEHMKEQHPY